MPPSRPGFLAGAGRASSRASAAAEARPRGDRGRRGRGSRTKRIAKAAFFLAGAAFLPFGGATTFLMPFVDAATAFALGGGSGVAPPARRPDGRQEKNGDGTYFSRYLGATTRSQRLMACCHVSTRREYSIDPHGNNGTLQRTESTRKGADTAFQLRGRVLGAAAEGDRSRRRSCGSPSARRPEPRRSPPMVADARSPPQLPPKENIDHRLFGRRGYAGVTVFAAPACAPPNENG